MSLSAVVHVTLIVGGCTRGAVPNRDVRTSARHGQVSTMFQKTAQRTFWSRSLPARHHKSK